MIIMTTGYVPQSAIFQGLLGMGGVESFGPQRGIALQQLEQGQDLFLRRFHL